MSSRPSRWLVALVAIPFAAVLFGIFMILVATFFPDDVVQDDYYKDGMAINMQLEQDTRASELGITARLVLFEEDTITFDVPLATEEELTLNMFHVIDQSLDFSLVLTRQAEGFYAGADVGLKRLDADGIWYVELVSTERNWRLRQRVRTPLNELEMQAAEP